MTPALEAKIAKMNSPAVCRERERICWSRVDVARQNTNPQQVKTYTAAANAWRMRELELLEEKDEAQYDRK